MYGDRELTAVQTYLFKRSVGIVYVLGGRSSTCRLSSYFCGYALNLQLSPDLRLPACCFLGELLFLGYPILPM